MKNVALAVGLVALLAGPVGAQDALLRTAAPAGEGLRVWAHTVVLPEGDGEVGLAGRVERALTDRIGLQGRVAVYNDMLFFGATSVVSLREGQGTDVALELGVHRSQIDGRDGFFGADLALVASRPLADRLHAFASLDLDREWPAPPFASIMRTHLVGGVELGMSAGVHLILEGGAGLGDDSPHYFSGALAFRLP